MSPMSSSTPYRTRAVRPLGVRDLARWQMKLYGIAANAEQPREEVVAAAVEVAEAMLQNPPGASPLDGYGFLIAHEGESACYYLIFRWVGEIFLDSKIFAAPLAAPRRYSPVRAGIFPCAWELVPIAHEREAWVAAMLAGPAPDPRRYLADTVSRDT